MYYSDLGFDHYDDFLSSKEWKQIKGYFYEHCKKYECGICGSRQNIALHKRSYKFLSLPQLKKQYRGDTTKVMRYLHTYLTYLCHNCHRKIHFYANGERVPLEYRKLKDRELALLRQPRAKVSDNRRTTSRGTVGFLGAYFTKLIKKHP